VFQNTGILTIVLVVKINGMVAHFTILFVLIVFAKLAQTPQVLSINQSINQHELAMAPHIQSSGAPEIQ